MSIRTIAAVGVLLCAAVTSLSIYLGVVEHAYGPRSAHEVLVMQSVVHRTICDAVRTPQSTTTTSLAPMAQFSGCKSVWVTI